MTFTRSLLTQVYELLGRGSTPLAIAQSMAMKLDDVTAMIHILKHS